MEEKTIIRFYQMLEDKQIEEAKKNVKTKIMEILQRLKNQNMLNFLLKTQKIL